MSCPLQHYVGETRILMMFGKRTPVSGWVSDETTKRVLDGLKRWHPRNEKDGELFIHVSLHLPFQGVVNVMTTTTLCVAANRMPI